MGEKPLQLPICFSTHSHIVVPSGFFHPTATDNPIRKGKKTLESLEKRKNLGLSEMRSPNNGKIIFPTKMTRNWVSCTPVLRQSRSPPSIITSQARFSLAYFMAFCSLARSWKRTSSPSTWIRERKPTLVLWFLNTLHWRWKKARKYDRWLYYENYDELGQKSKLMHYPKMMRH